MINLKYVGENTIHKISFKKLNSHIVQITGNFPVKERGFTCYRDEEPDDLWDYKGFKTVYKTLENGVQFSNDGSVYVAPAKPEPTPEPEPYVPTLEEVKEAKKKEMESIQRDMFAAGINVTLTDGSEEHFGLEEKEQKMLMALQVKVSAGDDKIPWHTSDETEHCKYYSNADMGLIITAAETVATYHETYIRDLRIYIDSMENKEAVEAVTYGMVIPEGYRSEVLQDMYAAQQEG